MADVLRRAGSNSHSKSRDRPKNQGAGAATVLRHARPDPQAAVLVAGMVAVLVRAVGDPRWTGELDFEVLEKLPAEYVGDTCSRCGRGLAPVPRLAVPASAVGVPSRRRRPHAHGTRQQSCTSPSRA